MTVVIKSAEDMREQVKKGIEAEREAARNQVYEMASRAIEQEAVALKDCCYISRPFNMLISYWNEFSAALIKELVAMGYKTASSDNGNSIYISWGADSLKKNKYKE